MEDQLKEDTDTPRVLKVLEALKQASHSLHAHPWPDSAESNSSAINALLELETESDAILSRDPNLAALSDHLAALKSLVETLENSRRRHGLRSFLTRRCSAQCLSRVAGSIESEIQAWIDRESLEALTRSLKQRNPQPSEDELVKLLTQFEDRVMHGFNRELQDSILKSKIFNSLIWVLCDSPNFSVRVREHAAFAIAALIQFNKDVFVGQVLMGPTIKALVTMASPNSIRVLCTLVRLIKSPLVDEIESNGELPKIIALLDNEDLETKVTAMACVLEIGYFGRKEAIDAMLEAGLIRKLVELQRSELGGDKRPLASCVARFAVQLEVGEGLRQRERRAFKQQILARVREASASDAEAATIFAEVLWGASP